MYCAVRNACSTGLGIPDLTLQCEWLRSVVPMFRASGKCLNDRGLSRLRVHRSRRARARMARVRSAHARCRTSRIT